ncbi:hypothetical protein CCR95_17105 [Thiocystis minor]|uniref:hypothetical protein n=1 Tax=Thiocystis minor TaxID=61597 RepID=UPI001912B379|nr:hypothetical protein [Thiocystis minor]MBK5965751.1 hypothetical protein [Thiocystis minor]
MENFIDDILLSERAAYQWLATAAGGIAAEDIPDESAELLPDGRLRIFCQMADGRLLAETIVEASDWKWSGARH